MSRNATEHEQFGTQEYAVACVHRGRSTVIRAVGFQPLTISQVICRGFSTGRVYGLYCPRYCRELPSSSTVGVIQLMYTNRLVGLFRCCYRHNAVGGTYEGLKPVESLEELG